VLHEVIVSPAGVAPTPMQGLRMLISKGEGARSKMPSAEKYSADAEVLRRALRDEPGNTRYAFYLAQSLRDAGKLVEARATYQRRIEMGGWDEEVYYSKLQVAALLERERVPDAEVIAAYLAAYQYRPSRAEPLCELARYCRESQRYALALLFARPAAQLPCPEDILFVEASVYEWRARDELSIAAYWCGDKTLSANLCRQLLADPRLPHEHKERVSKNLAFSIDGGVVA